MGKTPVVPKPECQLNRRCHPSGKQLNVFGTKFQRPMVRELAASSVLLGGPDTFHNDAFTLVASGTLVKDNVVLCAAHSIQSFSDKDIQIFMFFECNQKTAPPGSIDQYNPRTDFLNCTVIRPTTKPIAKGVKVIERGDSQGLDYALLAIEWTDFTPDQLTGQKIVRVPRFPVAPVASRSFSTEVLLVSHPSEQPTQATAGKLFQQFGPNPQTKSGLDYAYASFPAESGSSGGGVFNESGGLIGVLKGALSGQGTAFLNLSRVADTLPNSRITAWLDQGVTPARPSDPVEHVRFELIPE